MGVGAGVYMYDVVVKKFTFAISSPDEFLLLLGSMLGLPSDPSAGCVFLFLLLDQFKVIHLDCTLRAKTSPNFLQRGLTALLITLTTGSRRQPVTIDY